MNNLNIEFMEIPYNTQVTKNRFYGNARYFVQHCDMHMICDVMLVCSPMVVNMAISII